MGDYNRVQSYIKSHVLPKLDSLPDDVASVKNAFDAWKADWTQARAIKLDNLDAKVSTRATAADMGTALERVEALQVSLQNVTERVATIEKDVRNDAKTHAVKGVVIKKKNTPNPTELIMSITGKGTLYLATLSSNLINSKLIVELDGKLVSIVNNSHNNIDIGVCTTEAFNWTVFHNVVIRNRYVELTEASSNVTYDSKIKVNGITKNYYKMYCPSPITISDELFVDKDVNIVVDKYGDDNSTFGRDKGYQFTKSLKVYIDFSTIADSTTYATTNVMYRLEE